MKPLLFILCLAYCTALSAQPYTRAWRTCFGSLPHTVLRPTVQASAMDSAYNLYVAGFKNLYNNSLSDSIYLRKYNSRGDSLWEIREPYKGIEYYGGSYSNTSVALAIDRSSNVVLSYSTNLIDSNLDVVVSKYSASSGSRLWQSVLSRARESDDEQAAKLNIDTKGNIYLLVNGQFFRDVEFGAVAKFSPAGKQLWYQDMTGAQDYQAEDATLDSSGNVYATGFTNTSPKSYHYNILTYKFSPGGSLAWKQQYIGGGVYAYRVMYAKQDNSIVLCGDQGVAPFSGDSILAIKYTAGSRLQWVYKFNPGTPHQFNQSVLDADNNILLVSSQSISDNNNTYTGPLLTKLSPSGTRIWSRIAFGSYVDYYIYKGVDLKTDAQSHYYLLSGAGQNTLRLQKFDKDSSLLSETTELLNNSTYYVDYAALQIGKDQSIDMTASYEYASGGFRSSATACVSRYVLKQPALMADKATAGDKAFLPGANNAGMFVYPNPARDVLHFVMQHAPGSRCTVIVSDALGKQVLIKQQPASQTTVDISRLPPGVYVLNVMGDAGQSVCKFIRQ